MAFNGTNPPLNFPVRIYREFRVDLLGKELQLFRATPGHRLSHHVPTCIA